MLLEVAGLQVAYGNASVLHDVAIHVDQGEMVFVVGATAPARPPSSRPSPAFSRP